MTLSDRKVCPRCGIEKDRQKDFYQITRRRHEVVTKTAHWFCKTCAKESVKEYNRTAQEALRILKDRHPEEYKEILKQVRIGRRELDMPSQKEITDWLNQR